MKRRSFLKRSTLAGASAASAPYLVLPGRGLAAEAPDLVAVKNGEPDVMLDKAMAELGGMERFVKKGQTVVVKPNIAWNRPPELGANTHPGLVKRVVEHCVKAGAKKVYVLDHTVNKSADCYKKSGIEQAARDGGAIVVPVDTEGRYQKVQIPGDTLKETAVHEQVLEADVLVNVPVIKHHASAKVTLSMKNLMGIIWDRRAYHKQGLHDCIAEFCLFKKPDLNIADAYRVTLRNGPQRARPEDVVEKKTLLVSTDCVAIDAAAAKVQGTDPQKVQHIVLAAEKKVGVMDLGKLNIKRITV